MAPRSHASSPAQDDSSALNERERAAHLLARLAYGPRPGETKRLIAMGVEKWLEDQLQEQDSHDPRLKTWLSEYQTLGLSVKECAEFTYTQRVDKKHRVRKSNALSASSVESPWMKWFGQQHCVPFTAIAKPPR